MIKVLCEPLTKSWDVKMTLPCEMKDDIKEIKSDVKILLANLNQQIGIDKAKKEMRENRKSLLSKVIKKLCIALIFGVLSILGLNTKGE